MLYKGLKRHTHTSYIHTYIYKEYLFVSYYYVYNLSIFLVLLKANKCYVLRYLISSIITELTNWCTCVYLIVFLRSLVC